MPHVPCRIAVRVLLLVVCPVIAGCGGGGGGGGGIAAPLDFVHLTTLENATGSTSVLDHPALNGNPDMLVIATAVANPAGGFPRSFPGGPLRTEYDPTTGQWTLVDLAGSSGPDYAYNISIFQPGAGAFRHETNSLNVSGNSSAISHPLLDGQPDARVLVTMHKEQGSIRTGNDSSRHIGVWYDTRTGKWQVFNQDRMPMRIGIGFDIVVIPPAIPSYDLDADGTNGVPAYVSQVRLSAPWLTNASDEIVHVTSLWGHPGSTLGGVYLDSLPVLVHLDTGWALDANLPLGAAMPLGARFTVVRVSR